MKQRMLIAIQAVAMSVFILLSCSKRGGIDELQYGPPIDIIKTLSPGPMPPDSLEIDSLRRPQFQ